jgi:predicted transcriptional regulator/transcriptional regulator with XRE-family HTH domain
MVCNIWKVIELMGLKSQVKYPGFASYLRSHRERNYRSARDFCARVKIGISYPQYSRYEAGDQLPPLVQSITIFGQLGVSPLEALLEWNKAQLSDASAPTAAEPAVTKTLKEIEVLLNQVRSGITPEVEKPSEISRSGVNVFDVPLDKVVVFNRSHRDVFMKHPAYRDIFTYINAFHPRKISVEELSRALKVELPLVREMLENLERLGVVLRKDESFVAAKRNFYFPDDADFFELRNLNVRHNFNQLMDHLQFEALSTRQAFRGLITREFTPAQYRWVVDQSERLLAQAVGLPEDEGGDVIYSVMTVVGERFRRSQ